jgi:TetR/AcrR family transcriptional repressor of nem operon
MYSGIANTEFNQISAMTDSEIQGKARGRPRSFDDDTVVGAAMELFWRWGYAGVSVPDLSAATGLSSSSLYNAYGSKLQLFEAALDRYLHTRIADRMVGPLERGSEGLADVYAFLERLAATTRLRPPRGCLAVNTIAEFRHAPPAIAARTARYRDELRDGLRAALGRAAAAGEIPPHTVDARVATVVPMIVAFNLLLAAAAPARETRDLLAAVRAVAAG